MPELSTFDPREFCSSKLWEIVRTEAGGSRAELEAALAELSSRRHYLAQIEQLDEFQDSKSR